MNILKLLGFGRDYNYCSFKAGSRPRIILDALCEGQSLSGWTACKLLGTHNGDRELRRVSKYLKRYGINVIVNRRESSNGRLYKVISLWPTDVERARKLVVGEVA